MSLGDLLSSSGVLSQTRFETSRIWRPSSTGWPIWLAELLSSVLTLPALSRSLASLPLASAPEGCGSAWLSGAPEGCASVLRARAL